MVVSPDKSMALLEQPISTANIKTASNLFIAINLVKNTCLYNVRVWLAVFGSQLLHKFVCHSMNNVNFQCITIPH
jgi:hypothetical protein